MAKKKKEQITYHFNCGVTVDAQGKHPVARYNEGDEVGAEHLPPHIDLRWLISIGAVRPVEDK